MRKTRLLLLGLYCVAMPAFSQTAADIDAFNVAWGNYVAAIEAADSEAQIETSKAVLELGQVVLGESDERLPLLMVNHGAALIAGRRHDQAKIVLTEALGLAESIHGDTSVNLVPVLTYLADAEEGLDGRGRRRLYNRAISIVAASAGKDSSDYADIQLKAGVSLYGSDHWSSGQRNIKAAYKYYLSSFGDEDFRTGLAAFHLGKYAFSQQKFRSAVEHLNTALAGFDGDGAEPLRYQLHTRAMLVAALESRGLSDEATEHCVAIGRLSQYRGNQDYEPLFRQAPEYPSNMLAMAQQGFVDISFTVDQFGFVRNPEVVNKGSGDSGFEKAALEAVEGFRYAPQFEDGVAVTVNDVKTRISFVLE